MPGLVALADARGTISVWYVSTLLELVKNLPIRTVPVESFGDLDKNLWFSIFGEVPTCRAVAAHAKRILETDLRYPVILSPQGEVLDGMHRVAKAWITGLREVATVQVPRMPPPDEIIAPAQPSQTALVQEGGGVSVWPTLSAMALSRGL